MFRDNHIEGFQIFADVNQHTRPGKGGLRKHAETKEKVHEKHYKERLEPISIRKLWFLCSEAFVRSANGSKSGSLQDKIQETKVGGKESENER